MLKKLLIANRGEIACRIIRTARRMGVATVAVYSDADAKAMHVGEADEAVRIGPSPAPESYLVIDKIIAAAKNTGADSIHPGYGFLAENPDLADACVAAGLTFVGPSGAAMRSLGGKAAAKIIAKKVGVPVVPGFEGEAQDAATLTKEARRIGFPVIIKAVAGGGGRGMRLVEQEADLPALLESAQREAKAAFGDPRVLMERVVQRPRHIEVQVFGDRHGNVVHLFERDCTMQRRNQKVIEEAPAPGMSPKLRSKICGAAVTLAKAVGYEGAGTVEFLVEGGTPSDDAAWYFIEMNTRLQVEHPVTEEITGLDLVEWQLRVAAGEPLPLAQAKITMCGHAIEVRVCAEDASRNFLPSTGPIRRIDLPSGEGVRNEIGVQAGDVISPFYDSMIAKIITTGTDRAAAIRRIASALEATAMLGPRTNLGFLHALVTDAGFRSAEMDTGLIGRDLQRLAALPPNDRAVAAGTLHLLLGERAKATAASGDAALPHARSPWDQPDAFQPSAPRSLKIDVVADGKPAKVTVRWDREAVLIQPEGAAKDHGPWTSDTGLPCYADAERVLVMDRWRQTEVRWPTFDTSAASTADQGGTIRAPINGKVAKIFVAKGSKVARGDRIAIVEAMKMEHVLTAAAEGTVSEVLAAEGAQVRDGEVLARIG